MHEQPVEPFGSRLAPAEALREERDLLRGIFVQIPALVLFTQGPEHVIEFVNPVAYELLGEREFVGARVRDAFPEVTLHLATLDTVFTDGAPRYVRAAEIVPPEAAAARFFDLAFVPSYQRGVVAGVLLFGTEVTAEVTARDALRRRAQAAEILANVADGVFMLDRSGRVAYWNPAAERITGLAAATVSGTVVGEHVQNWEELAARIVPAVEPREASPSEVTLPFAFAGEERWLAVSAVTVSDGTVYAFRDVSREMRLQQLRDEIVATVSHELRTPLAAIIGAATTLQRRDIGAPTERQLLEMLLEQGERLGRIVDDVLTASALQTRGVQIDPSAFDLVELAREAVAGLEPLPPHLEIAVVAGADPVEVCADRGRVWQVLANLLSNAVKYSPHGGRVEVAVDRARGHATVAVSDEGVGIPAGEQPLVFERFYRSSGAIRDAVAGSGLGLYIARELAELMNGRLSVRSQAGVGSTFTLELPLAPPRGEGW